MEFVNQAEFTSYEPVVAVVESGKIIIRTYENLSQKSLGYPIGYIETPMSKLLSDLKDIWAYGTAKPKKKNQRKFISPEHAVAGKYMILWSFLIYWAEDHVEIDLLPSMPDGDVRPNYGGFANLKFDDEGKPIALTYDEVSRLMPWITEEVADNIRSFLHHNYQADPGFNPWRDLNRQDVEDYDGSYEEIQISITEEEI